MKMNLTGAIEILKLHKHTTDKFKHSVGDQYVSEAIDTVVAEVEKHLITSGWIDVSVQMPEDMEAFAEWVDINGYKQILKGVWNRDISYQQKMTTTQLRETWEEWKNE